MNENMDAGTALPAWKAALLRSRRPDVQEIMEEVAELRANCDAKWTETMNKDDRDAQRQEVPRKVCTGYYLMCCTVLLQHCVLAEYY